MIVKQLLLHKRLSGRSDTLHTSNIRLKRQKRVVRKMSHKEQNTQHIAMNDIVDHYNHVIFSSGARGDGSLDNLPSSA